MHHQVRYKRYQWQTIFFVTLKRIYFSKPLHSESNSTNQIASFDQPMKSDQSDCMFCLFHDSYFLSSPDLGRRRQRREILVGRGQESDVVWRGPRPQGARGRQAVLPLLQPPHHHIEVNNGRGVQVQNMLTPLARIHFQFSENQNEKTIPKIVALYWDLGLTSSYFSGAEIRYPLFRDSSAKFLQLTVPNLYTKIPKWHPFVNHISISMFEYTSIHLILINFSADFAQILLILKLTVPRFQCNHRTAGTSCDSRDTRPANFVTVPRFLTGTGTPYAEIIPTKFICWPKMLSYTQARKSPCEG